MEYFVKGLEGKQARKEYLDRHLTKIGCGSARCVYLTDNNTVLKLAKSGTARGIAQNKVEAALKNSKNPLVPKIISSDPNGRWVEVERLYPLDKEELNNKANISSLDNLIDNIESYLANIGKKPVGNEFAINLADFIKASNSFNEKLGIAIGDYRVYDHYGVDSEGNIKLRDYGLDWDTASRYYTNLDNKDLTLPSSIDELGEGKYSVRNDLGEWVLDFSGFGKSLGNDSDRLAKESLSDLVGSSDSKTLDGLKKISDKYPINTENSDSLSLQEIFSGTYEGRVLFEDYGDWLGAKEIVPLIEKVINEADEQYAQDYGYNSAEHMKDELSTVEPSQVLKSASHPKYSEIWDISRDIVDVVSEYYKPSVMEWLGSLARKKGWEKVFGDKYEKDGYSIENEDLDLEERLYSQLIEPLTIKYSLPEITRKDINDLNEYMQEMYSENKAVELLEKEGLIY